MDTAVKVPLSRRINFRLIAFLAIPVLLFGWFLYVYLDQTLTGGIANHGDYVEVKELKAIGNFLFDEENGTDDDIPGQYRALNGKRVLMTGQLYPGNTSAPEVKRFQLVYSIAQCCFNGPPRVQERVFVVVPDDLHVAGVYDQRIRVYGKLDVGCKRDPDSGKVVAVYRLVADRVEPV